MTFPHYTTNGATHLPVPVVNSRSSFGEEDEGDNSVLYASPMLGHSQGVDEDHRGNRLPPFQSLVPTSCDFAQSRSADPNWSQLYWAMEKPGEMLATASTNDSSLQESFQVDHGSLMSTGESGGSSIPILNPGADQYERYVQLEAPFADEERERGDADLTQAIGFPNLLPLTVPLNAGTPSTNLIEVEDEDMAGVNSGFARTTEAFGAVPVPAISISSTPAIDQSASSRNGDMAAPQKPKRVRKRRMLKGNIETETGVVPVSPPAISGYQHEVSEPRGNPVPAPKKCGTSKRGRKSKAFPTIAIAAAPGTSATATAICTDEFPTGTHCNPPVPQKSKNPRKGRKPKLHESPDVSNPRVQRAKRQHSYRTSKEQKVQEREHELLQKLEERDAEILFLKRKIETIEAFDHKSTVRMVENFISALKAAGGGDVIVLEALANKPASKLSQEEIEEIVRTAQLSNPGKKFKLIFDLDEGKSIVAVKVD